jgi:hypothetical protein
MRGRRRLAWGVLAVSAATAIGCQGGPNQRTVAAAEPGLSASGDSNTKIVDSAPARTVTFVDRHPLFRKPREYYDTSGDNKFIKTAAAAVVGVPAGILGELKQIIVGSTPDSRY